MNFEFDDLIQLIGLVVSFILMGALFATLGRISSTDVELDVPYSLATATSIPGKSCLLTSAPRDCITGITGVAAMQCAPPGCQNGLTAGTTLNFEYTYFVGGFSKFEVRIPPPPPTLTGSNLFSSNVFNDANLNRVENFGLLGKAVPLFEDTDRTRLPFLQLQTLARLQLDFSFHSTATTLACSISPSS